MSKIDNFPYPTPIPAKIWGVPFGVDPSYWGLQRVKRFGLSAVNLAALRDSEPQPKFTVVHWLSIATKMYDLE